MQTDSMLLPMEVISLTTQESVTTAAGDTCLVYRARVQHLWSFSDLSMTVGLLFHHKFPVFNVQGLCEARRTAV